jgi:hypothetical protein
MRTPGPASSTFLCPGCTCRLLRSGSVKKIQNVGLVKSRQLAQRSHRPTHLRPLQRAQKSHRDAHRPRHLRQGQTPLRPQLPQVRTDRPSASVRRWTRPPFPPQQFNDCRRVQSPHFPQKPRPLQQLHIVGGIQPVLAFRAARPRQPQALPRPDHRRRYSHAPRDISDLQVGFSAG